jgi:hypothetical protein
MIANTALASSDSDRTTRTSSNSSRRSRTSIVIADTLPLALRIHFGTFSMGANEWHVTLRIW